MQQMKLLAFSCGLAGILLAGLAGCGPTDYVGNTVAVKGKVTVDGKPATHGSVTFWPDAGNNAKYEATGAIGEDGTYTLSTRNKPGAAPGAYKVTVMIQTKVESTAPTTAKLEISPEFTKKDTTKLSATVVDRPAAGAYDFNVDAK